MQKLEKAGEPTMEEILASIRQIISEEPTPRPASGPPPMAAPSPQPAVVAPPPIATPQPLPQTLVLPAQSPTIHAPAPKQPSVPAARPQATPAASASAAALSSLQAIAQAHSTPMSTPLAQPAPATSDTARDMPIEARVQPSNPPAIGEQIALSDGLAGPPRRQSFGVQPSMIGVAPNAEQYSRSMWRFGSKRPVEPAPPAQPEPNGALHDATPDVPPAATAPTVPQPVNLPPVNLSPVSLPARIEPTLSAPAHLAPDVAPAQPAIREAAADVPLTFAPGRATSIVGPALAPESQSHSQQTQQKPSRPLAADAEPVSSLAAILPPPQAPALPVPAVMDARSTMSALAASLAGSALPPRPSLPRDTGFERPSAPAEPVPSAPPAQAPAPAMSLPSFVLPQATGAGPLSSPNPVVPVKSIEDVVVELLRPMLRQWLDDNMPRIVEKTLRVELAEQLKTPKT